MKDVLDIGFFELARNISKYSPCHPKMGAVIATRKPIGVGYNDVKTHTEFNNPSVTLRRSIHCESKAMINTGKVYVKNATIYVYREDSDGLPVMARPCIECMKRLKMFGVRRIFYTTSVFPYYRMERL